MTEMRTDESFDSARPSGPRSAQDERMETAPASSTLTRVYRNILLLYLVALLVSLGFVSARISIGLTAGTALGVAILASWQWTVARSFGPGKGSRFGPGALMLVKLPLVGAAIYFLLARDLVSPGAFALGFLIPQASIGLLALGQRLAAAPGNAGKAAA